MDSQTVVSTQAPFGTFVNRVCCVTAGPNRVFTGTVLGDIKVSSRATGDLEPGKEWRQDNTPIEGMMYDFEGKLVYATEFNLVILNKDFTQPLKEIRSYEPLRKFFLGFLFWQYCQKSVVQGFEFFIVFSIENWIF